MTFASFRKTTGPWARLGALALLGLLSACATQMQRAEQQELQQRLNTPVEVRVTTPPFDESQAKHILVPGANAIKGVVFHKIRSGGQDAGRDAGLLNINAGTPMANVTMLLFAETDHLKEILRLEKKNRSDRRYNKVQLYTYLPDPKLFNYVMKTQTDQNGIFYFKNLSPGKYYVSAVNQNIYSPGTERVVTGVSQETVGFMVGGFGAVPINNTVVHTQDNAFTARTEVEYGEFIQIPAGKTSEIKIEARMRPVK